MSEQNIDAARARDYYAQRAARPTTGWTHVLRTNHRHELISESVHRQVDLTPEDQLAARIRRLRQTPPARGWTQDGMALTIHQAEKTSVLTYLPPHAYTRDWEGWREYWETGEGRQPTGPALTTQETR